jgi:hypothetical protein
MYGAYCWKRLDNNSIIKMHNINNDVKLMLYAFWLCHGLGSELPVSHHGGPGLIPDQIMWDLW